jgi:pyruvate dehydrogenase E2 component (dihydrolipoamide acetyltransferase)
MAETVNMPKLGFDMAEGTLVRWVKGEGDTVAKGDVLAEIETDKATVEVESSFGGVVARHLVNEGTSVPVGDPIAIIAAPGEKVEEGAGQPPKEQPKAAEMREEQAGPRVERTDQKPVAGSVAAAEIAPSEVQTEAGAPRTSPENYQPSQRAVQESRTTVTGNGGKETTGFVKASPLARRVAEENGVDLKSVQGSGPGGRIVRKDVEAALNAPRPQVQPAPAPQAPGAAPVAAPAAPKTAAAAAPIPLPNWGQVQAPEDQHVPTGKLRAIIGKRMVESKQNVPHFYVTSEYKMEAALALRKQVNELLPEDQKLSVNDFIVKAAALALRQFPNINASIQGNEVVRHGHVNVGVAVALDNGLLTVVSRDADQKSLRYISSELKQMVSRARQGKVRTEDIEGSTFSISNLGMYEVENFIAIINPPEAAILAVGSAMQVPVVENGEVKPGMRMKATLSADHRVTDGAEAARFMQALRQYLENPMLLLV